MQVMYILGVVVGVVLAVVMVVVVVAIVLTVCLFKLRRIERKLTSTVTGTTKTLPMPTLVSFSS